MKFGSSWKVVLAVVAVSLSGIASGFARAEEHEEKGVGTIRGEGIELFVHDHAIAGKVRDFVVFGNKNEGAFSSDLIIKRDGQLVNAHFAKPASATPGAMATGTITHTVDGQAVSTQMTLVKFDLANQVIIVKANDLEIPVKVTAEAFVDDHFINPKYSAQVGDKTVEFEMKDGHACYGFSTHLIFMVLGSYLHAPAL